MAFSDRYTKKVIDSPGTQYARTYEIPNTFAIVRDITLVTVALIILLICWPFSSVPTGSRGVVTQFGRIVGIEPEGLVTLPPWQRLTVFSIRAEAATIEKAVGGTSDTQPVDTSLTVYYNISPDKVSYVFEQYSHTGDLSTYVTTATQEVFKAITAQHTATELIAQRAAVSNQIFLALQAKLDKYGAHVINIDMRTFEFASDYMRAIQGKVVQTQLLLQAENKVKTVEAEQRQRVAVAEAEANIVRAKAQGDADAAKAAADGNAYSVRTNATAAADALKLQNAALASSKDVLSIKQLEVQLQWAQNWKGEYPSIIGGNAPASFMNIPYPPTPGK